MKPTILLLYILFLVSCKDNYGVFDKAKDKTPDKWGFKHKSDTLIIRDTVYVHDTIYVGDAGVREEIK